MTTLESRTCLATEDKKKKKIQLTSILLTKKIVFTVQLRSFDNSFSNDRNHRNRLISQYSLLSIVACMYFVTKLKHLIENSKYYHY